MELAQGNQMEEPGRRVRAATPDDETALVRAFCARDDRSPRITPSGKCCVPYDQPLTPNL